MTSIQAIKLPKLLSMLPKDGLGFSVYQARWSAKNLPVPNLISSNSTTIKLEGTCRWEIKKVNLTFNEEGKIGGDAFGIFYWKGKRITPIEKPYEKVNGGLKYGWIASNPPLASYKKEKVVEVTA